MKFARIAKIKEGTFCKDGKKLFQIKFEFVISILFFYITGASKMPLRASQK